ncbi:ABC transporter ATP-binding protein [Rhodovulum sp. DZ06]|uniref:ABC transporter ATP-binding protein n=1 Tax=Rhodovulum sp. DZ06 TaxID=3425126 RepID=UPI003D341B22
MTDPVLRLEALRHGYPTPQGRLPVLDGVDLSLSGGETMALTGESGAGKSTLLHLAAGLDTAESGVIEVCGADMAGRDDAGRAALRRAHIGVVFQQFNLVPSLRVGDNIAFQARLAGREDPGWTAELADRLGLSPLLSRWPEELSGGQQQRAAVGRALAARPALLLADEPTGNLDEASADAVMELMLELTRTAGCALLMATHSAALAARLGRRAQLRGGRLCDETGAAA